ncbi:MAG TPA: hypothetical protein VHV83_16880 [Armatimonadota bacterium]|nr:hypothetical protein [Armatimonadota bacterium]
MNNDTKHCSIRNKRTLYLGAAGLLFVVSCVGLLQRQHKPSLVHTMAQHPAVGHPVAQVTTQPTAAIPVKSWHPRHTVQLSHLRFHGVTFQVVRLPRCEHLETCITYDPAGETLQHAKKRMGGIAALSGSFHNPQSMALADFLQANGSILSPARTNRYLLVIDANGILHISGNHALYKGLPGVSALSLGQRLLPLAYDGFPPSFMNRVTDRMAIGVNDNYIYLVQGKTTIWQLSSFIKHRLPCTIAINSDGGHVVRGRAPVHIVFRWRK